MGWDEVKKINSDFMIPLDMLIHQQTLMQNVSAKSIEWVLSTSKQLGKVLNGAYRVNSPDLEQCRTYAEILASPVARDAIVNSEDVTSMIINSGSVDIIGAFLNSVHVGKVFKTMLSYTGTQFDTLDTLEKVYANTTCMTEIAGSLGIIKILVTIPRALNLLLKGAFSNHIVSSAYNEAIFEIALNTCANNPAYFTRKAVAHYQNATATYYYHNIDTNAWVTTRPNQAAIYFIKQWYASSANANIISYSNTGKSATIKSGGFTEAASNKIGKFGIGTIGCNNSGTVAAIPASDNAYGEVFLAI